MANCHSTSCPGCVEDNQLHFQISWLPYCDTQHGVVQDVVTREGKMLCLYKRPGKRVIVDASGRLIIRPTHMEASVQKQTAGLITPCQPAHRHFCAQCRGSLHGGCLKVAIMLCTAMLYSCRPNGRPCFKCFPVSVPLLHYICLTAMAPAFCCCRSSWHRMVSL